jgi:hypothetical protein
MGRIHRYGQRKNCLIFNFVATNTIEGRVLKRLLEKLRRSGTPWTTMRSSTWWARSCPRLTWKGSCGTTTRAAWRCRPGGTAAAERGRAASSAHLPERPGGPGLEEAQPGDAHRAAGTGTGAARGAGDHRAVLPRGRRFVPLRLKVVRDLPHTFEPGRTPPVLRRTKRHDWKLPPLAAKYPRCSTDRETAEKNNLEWVTPGHPLFEAIRRNTHDKALPVMGRGATFYSLQHDQPARLDFYRARIVDGLGHTIHERLFAVELADGVAPRLREPGVLGDFTPAPAPAELPAVSAAPEAAIWLHEHALAPSSRRPAGIAVPRLTAWPRTLRFRSRSFSSVRMKRSAAPEAVDRKSRCGRPARPGRGPARGTPPAPGAAAQRARTAARALPAGGRADRERPHPAPSRTGGARSPAAQPSPETEAAAMRVVMEYERSQGRQVYDVHEKNLGYDVTSLDVNSGDCV